MHLQTRKSFYAVRGTIVDGTMGCAPVHSTVDRREFAKRCDLGGYHKRNYQAAQFWNTQCLSVCPTSDHRILMTHHIDQVAKAPSDALQALEHTTSAMVSTIIAERSAGQSTGGPVSLVLNGSVQVTVTLPERSITLSELQRMKRQFVNINRKSIILGTTEKGAVDWEEASIAGKFARYLEENVRQ